MGPTNKDPTYSELGFNARSGTNATTTNPLTDVRHQTKRWTSFFPRKGEKFQGLLFYVGTFSFKRNKKEGTRARFTFMNGFGVVLFGFCPKLAGLLMIFRLTLIFIWTITRVRLVKEGPTVLEPPESSFPHVLGTYNTRNREVGFRANFLFFLIGNRSVNQVERKSQKGGPNPKITEHFSPEFSVITRKSKQTSKKLNFKEKKLSATTATFYLHMMSGFKGFLEGPPSEEANALDFYGNPSHKIHPSGLVG